MSQYISRSVFSLIFIFFFCFLALSQKNVVDIQFDIENYENDTMILGFYFGDKTLVLDTLISEKKGQFRYQKDTLLEPGVYLSLFKPGNAFFQFMVNEKDQKFKLKGSFEGDALQPSGSIDNKMYHDYMQLITLKGKERAELQGIIEEGKKNGTDVSKQEQQLKDMDNLVKSRMDEIINNHPESITALLLKSNIGIKIPEFQATGDELQLKRYMYYKTHYFDEVDLSNPAVLRTPFIDEKVTYFMEKLTAQHPDSIFASIDYLLNKMEKAPEMYQFYTSTFLNKYANSNIIGYDAIYVKMIDAYYANGKTPWVSEETLTKFKENSEKLKPILIGKKAPAITFYKEDGAPVNLYDIDSEYTILIFWSPNCGHCKKAIPGLKEFYAKWNPQGVEILGVCTQHRDKFKECFDFAKEKEIPWITVGDQYHRSNFREVYNVVSTPRVFILDKEKEILLKRVPTERLDEIMGSLLKEIEMKRQMELSKQKQ